MGYKNRLSIEAAPLKAKIESEKTHLLLGMDPRFHAYVRIASTTRARRKPASCVNKARDDFRLAFDSCSVPA
jgi:hypothetical protein